MDCVEASTRADGIDERVAVESRACASYRWKQYCESVSL